MSLRVGVTATRRGLSPTQLDIADEILSRWFERGAWLHEGDCIGGDEQLTELAREIGYRIHSHPPTNPRLRAYAPFDEATEPRGYHVRNSDIVTVSTRVIGFPDSLIERVGSGTWSTINKARSMGRPVVIVLANGAMRQHNFPDPV